jgi:hypothetical protein
VVRFEQINGGEVHKVASNASGAFSISLPSGTYVITHEWVVDGVSGSHPATGYFDAGPHQLTVSSGEHLTVNFALAAPRL